MKRKRLFKIIIFLLGPFIVLDCLFFKPVLNHLSWYLSKTGQVTANILIVEGWLPEYAVESAYKEFQKNGYEYIITTGLKSDVDYYTLFGNGYLIFYPKKRLSSFTISGKHILEIAAFSELEGENRAHFNVFVNDSFVADFLADKKKRNYQILWAGKLIKIDSIMVQFDNDRFGESGDRNLYVKEVIIDHKFTIPFLNNSVYEISRQNKKRRVLNNFNSNAESTRNILLAKGMDSSRVIAVPGEGVKINRTLTSALAVSEWLKKSSLKVEGINIVSIGTHSRRTWLTYNKVLKKSYKIGIISLPDYKHNYSFKSRLIKILRETVAIIYYWFVLLPY
jgi:hypothetical protein